METGIYCWQMEGWPRAFVNRAALGDELRAFAAGRIEHRGSKKTGGYFVRQDVTPSHGFEEVTNG